MLFAEMPVELSGCQCHFLGGHIRRRGPAFTRKASPGGARLLGRSLCGFPVLFPVLDKHARLSVTFARRERFQPSSTLPLSARTPGPAPLIYRALVADHGGCALHPFHYSPHRQASRRRRSSWQPIADTRRQPRRPHLRHLGIRPRQAGRLRWWRRNRHTNRQPGCRKR
jgi:hypothetical protein